jgi:hypothetical protein
MKSEITLRRIRLALSIAGLFVGATLLSAGHCGGGGGGGGYFIQPDDVTK